MCNYRILVKHRCTTQLAKLGFNLASWQSVVLTANVFNFYKYTKRSMQAPRGSLIVPEKLVAKLGSTFLVMPALTRRLFGGIDDLPGNILFVLCKKSRLTFIWRKSLCMCFSLYEFRPSPTPLYRCASLWPTAAPPKIIHEGGCLEQQQKQSATYGDAISIISVLEQELPSKENAGIWCFGSTL